MPEEAEDLPVGTVVFRGGYETDPRDGGRPVVLIASALGVTPEIFREAFRRVKPARNGHPTPEQAQANKQVLLEALGKHGVNNDRLDEVSNQYRYRPQTGERWKHTPAEATAILEEGKVVGIKIVHPGSGYSSVPQVSVAGYDVKIIATVGYSQDFSQNGSITSLKIAE